MEYYFSQLSRPEQAVYTALRTALSSAERSVRCLRLEPAAMERVYGQLKLDHPEIFWVRSYRYYVTEGADYVELRPDYLFDKGKLRAQQQAVEARTARLLRPVQQASEEEKLRYIHDFILENVRYDKLKKEYSHEVFGPLCSGVGVCEGIAKTVKLLCDRLGLACIVVLCEADPANGYRYRHAWDLVKTGGQWRHLDATFDLTLSACGTPRYDYYNLSDSHLFRDHRPSMYPIPPAPDSGGFFYKTAGLSFTKPEDAEKRMAQALRKKQPLFVMHWRGGFLTREVLGELLDRAAGKAAERGLAVQASVNFPQAVVCFRFGQAGALLEENADAEEQDIDSPPEED